MRYADNPMFLFEYILNNYKDYRCIWVTKNPIVFEKLRVENKPVVKSNSLRGFWTIIRAKVLVSTVQFSDYNPRLLTNCILIDLGHGHPIKDPGVSVTSKRARLLFKVQNLLVDFHMIYPSEYSKQSLLKYFKVKPDNIHVSGFSRNDVFFDDSLRVGKNAIVEKIKGDNKTIVYMPTHRHSGKVKMRLDTILDFRKIQDFCSEYGYVFIIKKHFYHNNEIEDVERYSNIFDLTQYDDIDSQVLLYQTDILISDYSACYVDYLLLDRPLVFFHYDLDEFEKNERSIFIPFSSINIAPKPTTSESLVRSLKDIVLNGDIYRETRNDFRYTYFDNPKDKCNRESTFQIVKSILKSN